MSAFKILIDRLKGGHTQKIEETLDPGFLGPNEPELRFAEKVGVRGEAYLTDDHLILHLKAATKAVMPCAVCNEWVEVHLKVDNIYHTEPIQEIPTAIFDYSETLRESLLIELPKTVECNRGNCSQRAALKPFLRSETRADTTTHFPFADLE